MTLNFVIEISLYRDSHVKISQSYEWHSNHKWCVSKCDLRVCMIFTIVVNDVLCMQALLLSCIRSILNYMCTNFDNIVAVKWVYECVEREKRDGFSAVISSSFLCPPLLEVTSLCFWCYVVSLLSTRGIDSSY